MSHKPELRLHAYANRALDVRIVVLTAENPVNFTDITFRCGDIEIAGLTATSNASGFHVDFTLTADDLDMPRDVYRWELVAVVAVELRTIALGRLRVDSEPVAEPVAV